MSSPQVFVSEIDLSTRVPSFPGVTGAIVVQSHKGPVNQPFLITTDSQFLRTFTPKNKIEVGFSTDHFSALAYLEKSDKMWVVRAANAALYGGSSVKRSDAATLNQSLLAGFADPNAYVFDAAADIVAVAEVSKFTAVADVSSSLGGKYITWHEAAGNAAFYAWYRVAVPAVAEVTHVTCVADVAGSLNSTYFFLNTTAGPNYYVWYNVATAGVDPALGGRTGVMVALNTNDTANAVAVATASAVNAVSAAFSAPAPVGALVTVTNATAGAATDATAQTSGFTVAVVTQGANATNVGADPAPGGTGVMIVINQGDSASAVASASISGLVAHGAAAVSGQPTQFRITNAVVGAVTDATAGNSGFTVLVEVQGATLVNNVDECLLIYGSNQGVWNNDVGYKLTRYLTNPDKVKEPGAFLIEVFIRGNAATPVETFICSRTPGAKDGYGNNIYVEDVLKASEYIRALDNPAVAANILPLDQATILYLGGGDDGLAVTDSQMILAAQTLASVDNYFITVFMDGGHSTVAYAQALDALVSARKDSVAVLSVPYADESSTNYIADILDYRKTELNLNSSYSALFTPNVLIYDKFNDRRIFVSPEGYAAAAISFSAANFEIWFPPAGFSRGLVNVLDLRRRYTRGEMDVLYDAGINPIRFAPGKGIAIWGQKTLQSRPSATDRLNVRLLLITIEPAVGAALENFLFELNDTSTRNLAVSKIDDFMNDIKARRGVTDFKTVCDGSNNSPTDIDNNRMNVDLYVKPTRSVETIPLRVVITSTGVSFDQAAQQV